jgi:hypothetical protein
VKHLFPLMLASILITGCAHRVRYITVPCLTPEQLEERRKAEPPLVREKLTGKADEDIRIIGGSAVLLRSWGRGNISILEGCVGP